MESTHEKLCHAHLLELLGSTANLQALKLQVFFSPCERDMTEHILMIFPTLIEVRSDYVLTRVCGWTITCMLLHLRIALVLAFSLLNQEEYR